MTKPASTAASNYVLRHHDVCEMLGVSRATLWRWQRDGHFPKPKQIGPDGPRALFGWLASDIEAWLASRRTLRI